ncbi:MAG TPA: oligosaccharide flippase family protein [Ignavibacteriaceae bacterium]|nr:oligosaccharide flippase family protein [Ignavibacteriaceae bacterium]
MDKNTLFYFFITVWERLTFFILYLILARTISVEKYGLIITIFTFINILSPFLELGLPFYIQREIARKNNIIKTFNSALTLKIILAPFYFLLPFIYFGYNSETGYLLLIIPLIPLLVNLVFFLQSILYGRSDFKFPLIAISISRTIFISLVVLSCIFYYEFVSFLFLMVLILIIQLSLLIYKLRDLFKSFNLFIRFADLVASVKNSFPIGIGLIFITISDRVDILILEKLIDLNSVAFYAVAYTIFRNLQIISTTLLIPEYTKISAQYTINKRIAAEKFQYYYKYILIVSFLLIFFFYFFSNPLLVLLFGIKYSESSIYLQLLTLAIPGVFLNHLTGIICNSTLNSKIPAYSTGLGTLINLIVNFTTIPFWGIIGAVISTIITEYFIFIFQFVFLYKNDILNFKRS